MDYDDGFILQKDVNWSPLNERLAIPISVCSRLAHTGTVPLILEFLKLYSYGIYMDSFL